MQNLCKKRSLSDLYIIMEDLLKSQETLNYPIEVRETAQGIVLKIITSRDDLTLFFCPNHPVSEFNIIKHGMRLIYPKRVLKFKRHNVWDMITLIKKDERMRGYAKTVEFFLEAIIRNHDLYCNVKTS